GERIAELVPRGVSPDRIVFRILLVQFLRRGVAVEDSSQHGCGAGTHRAVVQVDFVLGDEELAAHFRPVRVFVLVEQRMVGQWRSLFELRQPATAEGEGRGNSSGSGGEEMTTVEHEALRTTDERNALCYDCEPPGTRRTGSGSSLSRHIRFAPRLRLLHSGRRLTSLPLLF